MSKISRAAEPAPGGEGQVLEVSRRHITLLSTSGEVVNGQVSSKALEVVTGDRVTFEIRDGQVFVTSVHPSERCLYRSYRGVLKRMGANIDRLFVITAVGETLNTVVIDRMLVAANVQNIPTLLVMNKADLGVERVQSLMDMYASIGVHSVTCSAKKGHGLEPLVEAIDDPALKVGALCGVSGVGKSTILNKLVPGADSRVGTVSDKTGQGRQTTTQPRGYLCELPSGKRMVLIDFPGVQFFGLSHIPSDRLSDAFEEFRARKGDCRFLDCRHLKEPDCAVRVAVEQGQIAGSRYESYLQIVAEIEDAREY
jgi:ribosome biogenesis GTPase